MPFIQVNMLEGRTEEQKKLMFEKVTQAVMDALDVPKERIRIMVLEVPKTNWCIAGKSAKDHGR